MTLNPLTGNQAVSLFVRLRQFARREQYGYPISQTAIFTPSDFAFPSNGIKGETRPNTEMTLIVDDIDLLKKLYEHGSVRILKDRRHDLHRISKLEQKGN